MAKPIKKSDQQLVERYMKKYKSNMHSLEKSTLAKCRSLKEADYVTLGRQLDAWKMYEAWVLNENGNLNALGKLPTIALDVITVAYANSPLPLIASIQPIEEQQGIVYFKNIRSLTSKGSVTEGDILVDPKTGAKVQTGFSGNEKMNEVVTIGDDIKKTITYTLEAKPVIRETLVIKLEGVATVYGKDVGPMEGSSPDVGEIIGKGVEGTVNYETGVVQLAFAVAIPDGKKVYASYQQNFERSGDLPKIQAYMDSTSIKTKVYALKGVVGFLQSFSMKKRWGNSLADDLATDLVAEINKEQCGDAIRLLRANAMGETFFNKRRVATNAISQREHNADYVVAVENASSKIVDNTGRGSVASIVAGTEHCALIASIAGFEKISDNNKIGPHVFGKLGDKVIIRVPNSDILGTKEGVGVHRGTDPFEAAVVQSTYMPLVVTDMIPESPNPMNSQRMAATMAGVKSVMGAFATKLDITDLPQ